MKTEFSTLGLTKGLVDTLNKLGYEAPTPIQAQTIPELLQGKDVLAQAQTGTGKTAAFALPILARLDLASTQAQALVIVPTRELAIQVAQAFQSYAKHMQGFHVAPIYGGQDYRSQLRALKRGVHVVVGTPGRIMDHMRRGSLQMHSFNTIVLDEADQMLQMGFIEDISWILAQCPQQHQTALFSATLPAYIKKIAQAHLQDPVKIHIKPQENRIAAIEQRFTYVNNTQKTEALLRFLELEPPQAMIIFVRTKQMSQELSEKLQACGYAAAALNGDIEQRQREKVINRIKDQQLDIIVATDVAARGIDVERISHVINYDIPYDVESYIHRIGRTGRAGRQGKALLFVSAREQGLLKDIQRATGDAIQQITPPTVAEMHSLRSKQLAEKVQGIISKSKKLSHYQSVVTDLAEQTDASIADIAAALAYLLQQHESVANQDLEIIEVPASPKKHKKKPQTGKRKFPPRNDNKKPHAGKRKAAPRSANKKPKSRKQASQKRK